MAMERRGPAVCSDSNKKEGKGGMIKIPISLQDLRRSLYVKAKAEATWRFWGLCVHVCKMETLQEAYRMAKDNDGAPGVDEVTFEAIEESGRESFLKQIQDELVHDKYQPMRVRKRRTSVNLTRLRHRARLACPTGWWAWCSDASCHSSGCMTRPWNLPSCHGSNIRR